MESEKTRPVLIRRTATARVDRAVPSSRSARRTEARRGPTTVRLTSPGH